MIQHIDIKNYALIENLSMDLHEGFNVITGETGSGKSIILGALGLLMGEKADAFSIRTGADEISVNAVLTVPEKHEANEILKSMGIETDNLQLIIRRTVKRNGRSAIMVQGQLLTRAELTRLMDSLIDMHGQSEHQSLLLPGKQQQILDSYAQVDILLDKCSNCYLLIQDLENEIEKQKQNFDSAMKQKEYLEFALNEIETIKPAVDEDNLLKGKIGVLSQFEDIMQNCSSSLEKLKTAGTLLFDAHSNMQKSTKADSKLEDLSNRLESQRLELEDITFGVSSYLSSVDYSEEAIDLLQERLSAIQKLKRKYGPEISDVLEFAENSKKALQLTQDFDVSLKEFEKKLEKAEKEYFEIAAELSEKRKKAAVTLETQISSILKTLGMPDAVFKISVLSNESSIGAKGFDSISFKITANKGEDLGDLNKIASGGELSRVMLSLKTVLAENDSIQTQVFDEIDTGIGGAVALNLAKNLKQLAEKKQVIAVTHLASIASIAETHFVVSKYTENGRTFTKLQECQGEDRVHEISRMLSGDQNEVSIEHARQLLGL